MYYVSVWLRGGLGNQLFQIFTAAAEAHRSGRKLVCRHDDRSRKPANGIFFQVPAEPPKTRFVDFSETALYAHYTFPQNCNLRLRFGYFQNKAYFDDCFEDCKRILKFRVPSPKQLRQGTVLHIRRGDYKHLEPAFDVLPKDYYLTACEGLPGPYTIVTDEAKDATVQELSVLLKAPICSASDDFQTLLSAEHKVLSNSTFSWWAAYLSLKNGTSTLEKIKCPPHMISKQQGESFLSL